MRSPRAGPTSPLDALIVTNFTIVGYSETTKPSIVDQSLDYAHLPLGGKLECNGLLTTSSAWEVTSLVMAYFVVSTFTSAFSRCMAR